MKKLASFLVVACLFVSSALGASLIIEGPAERGEGPLPAGGGQFRVDVYAEGVADFAGFDMPVLFVDELGRASGAFQLAGDSSNTTFGGLAIQHNAEMFPQIFPAYDGSGQYFGFMLLGSGDYSVDIQTKTLLLSATFVYSGDASGRYSVLADPRTTAATPAGKVISCALQGGSFSVEGDGPPPAKAWTLTVRSTGLSEVPISGSHPGTTDYAVAVDDGAVVNIWAGWDNIDGYKPYCWRDGQGAPIRFIQPGKFDHPSFVMRSDTTLVVEYVSSYTAVLSIEGPDQRGEGPVPFSRGAVTLDVYAEGFEVVQYMPVTFAFRRNGAADEGFPISTEDGNPLFDGLAVVHNSELFPEIDTYPNRYPAEVAIGLPETVELQERTWLFSVTFDYSATTASGSYSVAQKADICYFLGDGSNIPFESVAGSFTIADPHAGTLVVRSEGAATVSIGGSAPGVTDYTAHVEPGSNVSLSAPTTVDGRGFWRWKDENGTVLSTDPAYSFVMPASKTVIAQFADDVYTLTVRSDGASGVSITGSAPGTTDYTAKIADGSTVSLTAPAAAGGKPFQRWKNSTGGTLTTSRTCSFAISGNTVVIAEYASTMRSLTVRSEGASGVLITGSVSGTTAYTAQIASGTTVSLLAPSQAGTMVFQRWKDESGVTLSTSRSYSFIVSASKVVIAEFVASVSTSVLSVSSEGLSNVAITGSSPGTTDFTEQVVSGSTVNLIAPAHEGDLVFKRWKDTQDVTLSTNPNYSFIISGNTTVVAEYVPDTQLYEVGTLIVEGPADRGEPVLPAGGGTARIDVSADGFVGFGGFEVELEFIDVYGASTLFPISTQNGDPEFGGLAVTWNKDLFSGGFPFSAGRTYVGFMSFSDIDITGKTWLMSMTYEYPADAAGAYTVKARSGSTTVAGGSGEIPHTAVSGVMTIEGELPPPTNVWALTVEASGPAAVDITGTAPGTTQYTANVIKGSTVTLTAPVQIESWFFSQWKDDSGAMLSAEPTCSFTINRDTTVTAVYTAGASAWTLTVKASGPAAVEITGTEPGTTQYAAEAEKGSTVTLTAPWHTGQWFFSQWKDDAGKVLSQSATCSFTISRDVAVTAVYTSNVNYFYVSPTGSNDNAGTSMGKPMASIQALLDRYPTIGANCTLILAEGTYHENVAIEAGHAGLTIMGTSRPWQAVIDGALQAPCISLTGFAGTIRNLVLRNGYAVEGGGIRCEQSSPVITNVIIMGNQATSGGGVFCQDGSPVIENCTIAANVADSGGGISSAGQSSPEIRNCIIWGNTAGSGPQIASTVTGAAGPAITFSDVQGGAAAIASEPPDAFTWGSGNLDADPLFADAANGDVHLQSQTGRWNPAAGAWITDAANSPCIDAGNPLSPFSSETYPNGNRINMGAFGNTAEASRGEALCSVEIKSTPPGAAITGNFAGTAPYVATVPYGSTITPVAPWEHAGLYLSLWSGPSGFRAYTAACSYTITGDTILTVAYEAATEFYVSQMGDDANSGTGFVKAVRSIQTLLDRYPNIGTGCIVNVGPGVYPESVSIGSSHAGIVIMGAGVDVTMLEPPAGSPSPCIRLSGVSTAVISCIYISGGAAGGIVCDNSSPIITGCTIIDCKAVQGAGICCIGVSAPTILGNMIVDNAADLAGGGVWCDQNAAPTLDTNIIASNRAWFGAGIFAGGPDAAVGPAMVNNVIFTNTATDGGGIYCAAPAAISRNLIVRNLAARGAGVFSAGSNAAILGCVITGNTADTAGGLYCREDAASVTLTTITGNRAADLGPAVFAESGSRARFDSTIIWSNASGSAAEIWLEHSSPELAGPDLGFARCCIAGGRSRIIAFPGCSVTWGEGNLDVDPRFVYSSVWTDNGTPNAPLDDRFIPGNYRLAAGSPCIDAGLPGELPDETDIAGAPRLAGSAVDMGAFEYQGSALLFVDDDAPLDPAPGDPAVSDPLEDGTAAHPFDSIQEAINAASDSQVITVLDGTYRGPGNRDIDFSGKAIIVRSQNGPLRCTVDCGGSSADPHRGFIFANGETDQCVLHGFTIANAWLANGRAGGAILCEGASPIIINTVLRANSAGYGAGIGILDASPIIANNTIAQNAATQIGGGIWCAGQSQAAITYNAFTQNSAAGEGGGIYDNSASMITNNTVTGNSAGTYGGGLALVNSTASISRNVYTDNTAATGGGIDCGAFAGCLVNNLVARNTASANGGGISSDTAEADFVSNTITGNTAASAGGGLYCKESLVQVINCIIWGNTAPAGAQIRSTVTTGQLTVEHCSVNNDATGVNATGKPIVWGDGIVGDPLFVDLAGDYHLLPGSPCTDAGNNDAPIRTELDMAGLDRVLDGNFDGTATIDLGAFEFLPGDANYDGKINIMDLVFIRNSLGRDPSSGAIAQRADINGDGTVTADDILLARTQMTGN